jgi:SAM-dependent methyltransferase
MADNRWMARVASVLALTRGTFAWLAGRRRHCVVCRRTVPCFLPWRGGWRAAAPLMRQLHMIGSDLDHFACPRCGATDRDRHLRLYLDHTGLAKAFTGRRLLHIAPEASLQPWIASLGLASYVRGDLFPASAGIEKVDLEAMPFADASFDYVIANHVLEHVAVLDRATAEIRRVLAPGGIAVLQTPWCAALAQTIDDPGITDPAARLQLYGQDDHVRLFGRDVFERIARTGLVATPMAHEDVLPTCDADEFGVNAEEVLMLFKAP